MALPLLQYAPTTQNNRVAPIRVASDENERSQQMDIAMDADNVETVIESAYRQVFFHAFKSDRDAFLEPSSERSDRIVRDFIRGLCLSDTFKRTFYGFIPTTRWCATLCRKSLAVRPTANRKRLPGPSSLLPRHRRHG